MALGAALRRPHRSGSIFRTRQSSNEMRQDPCHHLGLDSGQASAGRGRSRRALRAAGRRLTARFRRPVAKAGATVANPSGVGSVQAAPPTPGARCRAAPRLRCNGTRGRTPTSPANPSAAAAGGSSLIPPRRRRAWAGAVRLAPLALANSVAQLRVAGSPGRACRSTWPGCE